MPHTIVFATNNAHKLDEIRALLGAEFHVRSLSDIGCHDDIPEDGDTLEANAIAKARWVADRYGVDCFADDTGLEVDALDGQPGVHTARYAPGSDHDATANMRHLLANLAGVPDQERTARFRTVIALILNHGEPILVDGTVEGFITDRPRGDGGFGYDPVFMPVGWSQTFGQASPELKNTVSHRARASQRLVELLKQNRG